MGCGSSNSVQEGDKSHKENVEGENSPNDARDQNQENNDKNENDDVGQQTPRYSPQTPDNITSNDATDGGVDCDNKGDDGQDNNVAFNEDGGGE